MIEAFSFGCPVIASDAAAIPEIMRPILPECIVSAGDVDALQEKARQVMANEINLPDQNSLIDYARCHYSHAVIVPRFVALFEQAVRRAHVST
jgi:glycosyltransferase involved in cell wall biosynthesis